MNKIGCKTLGSADSYAIVIEKGVLSSVAALIKQLNNRFAIIADETVGSLYGLSLQKQFLEQGFHASLFTFPAGEKYKTRATKEILENQLFQAGFGRDSCFIALGGGVVTDLVGYLAATFCRGVPLVLIPTTLLAMSDAAIGGKTAVNTPHGKNLIGAFYPPKQILIDPALLVTLPPKEIKNGLVEMIKHALIADDSFFCSLEKNYERVLTLDFSYLEEAILQSCRIKQQIVEQDEREEGKRRLLNFGHTVGHAVEQCSDYSLSHGEAVAIGLAVESSLALQLDYLDSASFERICSLLAAIGLSLELPENVLLENLSSFFCLDKKSVKGKARFILIDKIGSAMAFDGAFCTEVEQSHLQRAFKTFQIIFENARFNAKAGLY